MPFGSWHAIPILAKLMTLFQAWREFTLPPDYVFLRIPIFVVPLLSCLQQGEDEKSSDTTAKYG